MAEENVYVYIFPYSYILIYLIIYKHIHTYNGMLFSLKKEANLSYCLSFARRWMKLGENMPSEIRQSQKDIFVEPTYVRQ